MEQFLFLGTCACDYSPRLQSDLKDRFDPNARRSSSALLNSRYLIDCGDHVPNALSIAGVDRKLLSDIFITHTHGDHFRPENIAAVVRESQKDKIRLWIRSDAMIPDIPGTEIMRMEPFVRYEVSEGLAVTGLKANHDPYATPQWLLFETGEKKLLYALDGAWYLLETYYFLRDAKVDVLIADATVGDYDGDYRIAEHNSIPMLRLLLPSLKTFGVITENTSVYLSHLAPSLHKSHEETVRIVREFGADVAYDGLEIQF